MTPAPTESNFVRDFRAARRASVPLLVIQSADIGATIAGILKIPDQKDFPMISWDIISGFKPLNDPGSAALAGILGEKEDPTAISDPLKALKKAAGTPQKAGLPRRSILFLMNAHRFIGNQNTAQAAVGQAIWNLRDDFKSDFRTVVLLGPSIVMPEELKHDVMILDEPLPDKEEIQNIIISLHESAKVDAPVGKKLDVAIEAVRGLSAFEAEQAVAMSFNKKELDLDRLWERKRMQVEQTPGINVYRGTETFDDFRGSARIKEYLSLLCNGEDAPTSLVFMDEIEKMFAGIQGDLSGTSQEQHGEFLRWTQDKKIPGIMLVGHAGCGKSLLCKALAGQFHLPMVELNMTALKGGIVGQTGSQTRAAFKQISAMGRPMLIASSNSMAILPPELKRRFKLGTFFFDLPTDDEKQALWALYLKRFNITGDRMLLPPDKDWTPSDIQSCCELAWKLKTTLVNASSYLVPICKSDPDKIEALRMAVNGKFLNASAPGTYTYNSLAVAKKAVRSLENGEGGNA